MNHPELFIEAITTDEVHALKALQNGTADAYQQRLGLAVILHKLSNYGELCYFPGDASASTFMAGRVFVGYRLAKLIAQPFDRLGLKEKTNV